MRRTYATYSKYSGVSTVRYTDPLSEPVHVVDAAHGVVDLEDAGTPWVIAAPELPAVAQADPYPGLEWVDTYRTPELDQTDYRSHEGRDTYPAQPDRVAQQQVSGIGHSENQGAALRQTWFAPRPRILREQQVNDRRPGIGPGASLGVNPVALQRGLNALPENNPDGFHPGTVRRYMIDRKFYAGQRVHDQRPLIPRTVTLIGNVPPTGAPNGSPFSSFARSIKNVWQRPDQRREPEGVTAAALTDGMAGVYQAAYPASVADDYMAG